MSVSTVGRVGPRRRRALSAFQFDRSSDHSLVVGAAGGSRSNGRARATAATPSAIASIGAVVVHQSRAGSPAAAPAADPRENSSGGRTRCAPA